jgi:hypothetical protein
MSFAAAQELPIAPARRAAIFGALWEAAQGNAHLRGIMELSGATIVDDICALAAIADRCGVSDVTLALAAAQESSPVSLAARVLYTTRLQLRAAGFLGPHADVAAAQNGRSASVLTPAMSCGSLSEALKAFRAAGATRVRAPRSFIEAVAGVAIAPDGAGEAGTMNGIVGRLLLSAYSTDARDLIEALCGPPYRIDPAQLRLALASARDQSASTSTRQALARAVSTLPGAVAKDAALAALSALDAALRESEAARPSIAAAASAVEAAVQSYVDSVQMGTRDTEFLALQRAAASADRVWACTSDPVQFHRGVANVLENLTTIRIDETLELVTSGNDASATNGSLEFSDSPGMPIGWETLATALDIPRETREGRGYPGGAEEVVRVEVAAALTDAVAAYQVENARSSGRRVWPHAETLTVIKAPPMTFSASRLNAFVKCPRRWFYEYLCEALEDPSSLHATYGRVVHDALEALHRQVRVPSRHDPDIILERFLHELDVAFGKARPDFVSQLEYEVSRMRARRMAAQYVRWLVLEASRAPMEIVQVELLQRRRFGDHDFMGYIDRIDRPLSGGPVTIFDYKTGRIDADPAEYLEKVRRGDEAQLALYYAMRRADGDEIARIALVSLRDPRDDAWILALDITDDDGKSIVERQAHDGVLRVRCSRADLEESLTALLARCDLLTKQGLEHFPAGDDPPCNFCAYAISCRERPVDEERIFAR